MKKLSCILLLLLSGCSSIKIDPQAMRILASTNPAPKECQYLGQVFGHQGNFFTGGWTPNQNLEEGAMNDLKNKAHQLGANYIHILKSRAGVTGSYGEYGGGSHQTNVTNTGNAYRCPESVLNGLG